MAKLGFRTINEMVGRSDKLRMKTGQLNFKTVGLDLTPILTDAAKLRPGVPTFNVEQQRHSLADRKDNEVWRIGQ
jgi:glutamate synthase (NADPH/NADH)